MCRKLPHLLLVLSLATGAPAQGQRPEPKAATPEEAVKCLIEAAKADDVDAFQAQLGAHSRAVVQMGRALEAYFAALDEKFGENPKSRSPPTVKEFLLPFKTRKYQVRDRAAKDKERVDLTVWETGKGRDGKEFVQEETWVTVKEPSGWKVVLPPKGVVKNAIRKDAGGKEVTVSVVKTQEFDAAKSAQETKMWRQAEETLVRLTRDVRGGKYASREQVEAALRKAKEQIRKAK